MGQIIRDNPVGGNLLNDKPVNSKIDSNTQGYVYLETRTTRVGEPMGLLLALTYPTTETFIGERV